MLHLLCKDHLNSVLPIILSLVNANKDQIVRDSGEPVRKRKSLPAQSDVSPRSEAARKILEFVRSHNVSLVSHVERLCLILIGRFDFKVFFLYFFYFFSEFANFDASPWKNKPFEKIAIPASTNMSYLSDPKSLLCRELNDVTLSIISSCNRSPRHQNSGLSISVFPNQFLQNFLPQMKSNFHFSNLIFKLLEV